VCYLRAPPCRFSGGVREGVSGSRRTYVCIIKLLCVCFVRIRCRDGRGEEGGGRREGGGKSGFFLLSKSQDGLLILCLISTFLFIFTTMKLWMIFGPAMLFSSDVWAVYGIGLDVRDSGVVDGCVVG